MKISLDEVAKELGLTTMALRLALRTGTLPFGTAYKIPGNKNYTYIIYPEKYREYVRR